MPGINSIQLLSKYIFERYNTKSSDVLKTKLRVNPRSSFYKQIRNLVEQLNLETQKRNTVYTNLCKMYFLIHFNCSLGNSKLPETLFLSCITKRKNDIIKYKNYLKELGLIRYSGTTDKRTYVKEGKVCFKSDCSNYYVSEPVVPDLSSKDFKKIEYNFTDDSLFKFLKGKIGFLESNNKQQRGQDNNNGILFSSNCLMANVVDENKIPMERPTEKWSEIHFKNLYKSLIYIDTDGTFNLSKTNTLKNTNIGLNPIENRYYSAFHSLKKEERKNVYLHGEHIVECFDVSNCYFVLLSAILDDTIPTSEADDYTKLVRSGKFYEAIATYVNNKIGAHTWERTEGKTACVKYLAMKTSVLDNAVKKIEKNDLHYFPKYYYEGWVDLFFRDTFPHIREFIGKKKEDNQHALVLELNKIETTIIVKNIIKELYEKYGIEAISLHDAIFVKESDNKKMNINHISTKKMFFECLDAYKLL